VASPVRVRVSPALGRDSACLLDCLLAGLRRSRARSNRPDAARILMRVLMDGRKGTRAPRGNAIEPQRLASRQPFWAASRDRTVSRAGDATTDAALRNDRDAGGFRELVDQVAPGPECERLGGAHDNKIGLGDTRPEQHDREGVVVLP
jgi:hypothetical protein